MIGRRYRIPSTSALVAFESAARHCNFSRAAEELNTSQSAISRHMADLESRLGTRLFERRARRVRLTEQGDHFYRAVASALETLQTASVAVGALSGGDHLTIACSHEISHLLVMPRFEALQSVVGDALQIRVITYEYDALDTTLDPRIDLLFTYRAAKAEARHRAIVLNEAVAPVCSPSFAKAKGSILSRPVREWGALPFLKLTKRNLGWATWEDWFERVGRPQAVPKYLLFDNYVYLLEAAAAGRGLGLGWRGLVDRHLRAGTLVAVTEHFEPFERPLYALLTQRGRTRRAAHAALEFFRPNDSS